jgi:predicted O-methyltransferase YrrM
VTRPTLTGIGMTSARTRDRLVARLREQGIVNPEVLERIRSVPRHLFVDEALASRAYEDTALPIGHGQTISQPYIVALMTQSLLEAGKPRKVLEVGTGCGYQTAVLAPLVVNVYSVERIAALQLKARRVLRDLRISSDVIERCLNHTPQGIVGVYQTGELLAERKEAFDAWGRELERLMKLDVSNVATLNGARAAA